MLTLADLKDQTQDQIKAHIAENYAGKVSGFYYGTPSQDEKDELLASLRDVEILVAYESVGSWGCDSSSWFLFRDASGKFFTSQGSHCSCYGFEGQWEPEEVTTEYLKSEKFYFSIGGYDDDATANEAAVKQYLGALQ